MEQFSIEPQAELYRQNWPQQRDLSMLVGTSHTAPNPADPKLAANIAKTLPEKEQTAQTTPRD